jgi:hypothetical protein
MKNIKKIASEILKESMGMKVLEPVRSQSREILRALRQHFGIEVVEDPIWREYITFRSPSQDSNKFHYFVVFKVNKFDGSEEFVAANAYARIGYTPKVVELGSFSTKEQALVVAKNKLRSKLLKGYGITLLQ